MPNKVVLYCYNHINLTELLSETKLYYNSTNMNNKVKAKYKGVKSNINNGPLSAVSVYIVKTMKLKHIQKPDTKNPH